MTIAPTPGTSPLTEMTPAPTPGTSPLTDMTPAPTPGISPLTDMTPALTRGTSPLPTTNMGAASFPMTVPECQRATTAHAARAPGLAGTAGRIAPGLSADFALRAVEAPVGAIGRIDFNRARIFEGEPT